MTTRHRTSSRSGDSRSAHPPTPAAPRIPRTLRPAVLPQDDLDDECVRADLHYVGADLSGRRGECIEIARSRLDRVTFNDSRLLRSGLSDVALVDCDLANVEAHDFSLLRVHVDRTRIMGASLTAGYLRDVVFDTCRADLVSFRSAQLTKVVFRGSNLCRADFSHAQLRGVTFTDCNLTGAQFSHATMADVRLERCELTGLGGPSSLRGATVDSTDLIGLGASLAREAGITVEPA